MNSKEKKLPPIKPGRVDGRNSSHRSEGFIPKKLKNEIFLMLKVNRDKAVHKKKKVGQGTQDKRETVIYGFFADLLKLKYRIESIYSLKQKHLVAVFNHLEAQGQSPSTIQNKISIMRVFCEWAGKYGMVNDSSAYVKDRASVRRTMVAQEDKSWDGKGVDVLSKLPEIAKKDKAVALWLEICWAFGLRVRESIMSRPGVATEGKFFWVWEGTKGKRPRIVPIETQVQMDVIERAKLEADGKTGYLGERGKTYEQKRRRFYGVMESLGITLSEEGVTAHGLRHQYMQDSFKRLLGIDAPVKGGDLSQVDKDELHVASQKLMERAGHTRVSIGSSYYGSRRRKVCLDTGPKNDATAGEEKNLSEIEEVIA